MEKGKKISVVLPCRNEEDAIGLCIDSIKKALAGKDYEIIVSVSGDDDSARISEELGVKVIRHQKVGYGNAYLEGLEHANGEYIVMGDADSTYDFLEIPGFIEGLDNGYDLVIGNRFLVGVEKGSMPFIHRYIGNPFLSGLLRVIYGSGVSDSHCGFRAIRKDALKKLGLQTTGMEFASEMIVRATRNDLKIKEIPVTYRKRIGKSKMRSFRDGFRHLSFIVKGK